MKNREFKFRAWTGIEMCQDVMVGRFGNFYVNPYNNGINEHDSACLSTMNTKYPDTLPIMQFSGFKDKNGKEIWEGDIVKCYDTIGSIIYNESTASFDFTYPWSSEVEPLYENCTDIQVIGNIYENPELLK